MPITPTNAYPYQPGDVVSSKLDPSRGNATLIRLINPRQWLVRWPNRLETGLLIVNFAPAIRASED